MVRKQKKGNGVVIGSHGDYQNLPANKKWLMPFIQTKDGVYIQKNARFFTCIKELKGFDTIIVKCVHFRTIGIPPYSLIELRREYKNFSLTSFDEWITCSETITTWQQNYIRHNRCYEWPEYWLGAFLRNATPLYTKCQ